jgi:hypothetical protein
MPEVAILSAISANTSLTRYLRKYFWSVGCFTLLNKPVFNKVNGTNGVDKKRKYYEKNNF